MLGQPRENGSERNDSDLNDPEPNDLDDLSTTSGSFLLDASERS